FNNLISTNKYTQSDLSSYINDSANATDVKNLVVQNLYVSDTIKLDSSQIGAISSNANGIVTINLVASANVKYTAEENENVTISNNKITILNLKYYSEVRISSLSNTYNYFQKIISDNNYYISSSFGTYVTQNQSTIKSEFINNSSIIVIGGDGSIFSSSDITSVTFNSSEQLVFTLKDVSYRKYSIQSATNVTVSGNTITFSGFNWAKYPSESYFTWNGNQITGLTTLGTQQTNIVLPPRATSINNIVFMNNKTIRSVDMSLTTIRSIPNGASSGVGLFYNATNLVSVSLPSSLTSIGDNTFSECTSLTSITLPDSLGIIGNQVFFNCKSLTSINLPNSIYSIGYQTFYSCSFRSVTLPNSLTKISSDLLWNCKSLISVDIPNSVTSIGNHSFYDCPSLTSITMSNSVTSIGIYAFSRVPSNCVMIVKSGWNTQLATNAAYEGAFRYI
ncbi:MAG: leucine-rich repeat protein, partial [Ureaplasma sp.]|nr:leucine-rich repeat protein [Ureaplasma sp.]